MWILPRSAYGYKVADELGTLSDEELHILDQDKLLEALRQMHFNTDTYPCMREGFIRKDGASKGQYRIAGNWFSSPSALAGLVVDWMEDWENEDDIALDKAQQAQIKDFIRGYYPKLKIKAIYLFHKQTLNEEASTAPLSVVLVTPPPEAVTNEGGRTVRASPAHTSRSARKGQCAWIQSFRRHPLGFRCTLEGEG